VDLLPLSSLFMSRSKTYEVHRQKDMTLMLAFVHILQLQAGLHDRVASAEAAISLADAQAGKRRALAQAALDVVEAKMAATEAEKADLDRQEAEANKVSRQAHEHAMSWMVGSATDPATSSMEQSGTCCWFHVSVLSSLSARRVSQYCVDVTASCPCSCTPASWKRAEWWTLCCKYPIAA
jgi:hypothetical protein